MYRRVHTEQHRPDHGGVGSGFQQVEADVARVQVRHDEQIRHALQAVAGEDFLAQLLNQRVVRLHLAFDFQIGATRADFGERGVHVSSARQVGAGAEVGRRQQRDFRRDAEHFYRFGGVQGDGGQLVGIRVFMHLGVGDENRAFGRQHQAEGGRLRHIAMQAKDAAHAAQVAVVTANHAAKHGVGIAEFDQHRRQRRRAGVHLYPRFRRVNALARAQLVVGAPAFFIMRVVHRLNQLHIFIQIELQMVFGETLLDTFAPADENRLGDAFLHTGDGSADDAHIFALGKGDAQRVGAGALNNRLHRKSALVKEQCQFLLIFAEVFNRTAGNAAIHRRLGDGNRNGGNQARVKRFGDDIILAVNERLPAISGHDFLAGRRLGKIGDGIHRRHFHRLIDGGRAHIERATEQVREAENVIDLVRIIRAAGGDNRVIAYLVHLLRHDFRHRVGKRQHQRFRRHRLHHLAGEQSRLRDAKEDVRARERFREAARFRLGDKLRLASVELAGAAFINRPLGIADDDVLLLHAQIHKHIQTRHACRARARGDHAHLGDVLVLQAQCVDERRRGNNRGAVLVVVENRDVHPLLEAVFNFKTFRRLDVFQVDTAKRRLQRGDRFDKLLRVGLIHFDIKHINPGKLLEQHALAFHDGLAGECADITESQHRRAVGNHRHQIGA